jgi:hypothetical protein
LDGESKIQEARKLDAQRQIATGTSRKSQLCGVRPQLPRTHSHERSHLLRDSSSVSKVFCRRNSSIKVAVISRSRSDDAATEIGGVTPQNLVVLSTGVRQMKGIRPCVIGRHSTRMSWALLAKTRQARWCEETCVGDT